MKEAGEGVEEEETTIVTAVIEAIVEVVVVAVVAEDAEEMIATETSRQTTWAVMATKTETANLIDRRGSLVLGWSTIKMISQKLVDHLSTKY